jgi:mono/diheme cytochrome c family protein
MIRRFVLPSIVAASFAALLAQSGCRKDDVPPPKSRAVVKSAPAAVAETKPAESVRAGKTATAAKLSFNAHIQPILAENCYACHGADPGSRKADLRLDRAEHAYRKRKDGDPAIVAGKPDASPLVQRIESTDEKKRMPPAEAHKTLNPEQIATLRRWVAEGGEYEEHWSFIPPQRPAVPASVSNQSSVISKQSTGSNRLPITDYSSPIDAFIRAELAKHELTPSPEADRRTLIRRVTLDLTGIVPTPEEVEAFVADQAPDAYEKVVDRLLASQRYGEHRARYWLDYARYGDTHGIHLDNYRAIWPYRDYVVRAFNANKRFDIFVREQLAGDLLPARTLDELTATGFVRCNLTTNEGGTIPEETYINQTRDRVEAFGATFLGLTTGCAACHDHKFDPFTQKDHYSLAAFLGNTAEKPWDLNIAEPLPVLKLPKEENKAAAEFVLAKRAELQEKLDARRARSPELVAAWLAAGNAPKAVSTEALELRLRLDEGKGDVVKNSAPNAKNAKFKADTNPLIWGENTWLWPSMRMDILSRLNLGNHGDVDAGDKFSAGGWLMLRAKPGGGVRTGTGNGSLLARMGDAKRLNGAGWDIFQENGQFTINLVPVIVAGAEPMPAEAPKKSTKKATSAVENPRYPAPPPAPKRGITVTTKGTFLRDEWLHVFFTYDGSRKAAGLKLFVNGKPVEVDVKLDTLAAKDSIRTDAAMHLGRRDDYQPMRETRFQDVRFYKRALAADEVSRLPFEDLASEIVARQPDPTKWTTEEKFVVADRFYLGEKDTETIALASAVAAHESAFDALTKDGTATLIALEKTAPAFADILKRGDYFARQQRVEPSVPHFLPELPSGSPRNRRGLAEWLLAPSQPLMTRVTVNRMWQELFGRGIVESAGDFGIMGDRPSHPELLDWLAVEFRESGWDVKKFYRLLVTSATYRQTAAATPDRLAKDAGNKLLSRGPRFRMDGEMLRDSALAVSGLLVEKLGGPSVKPYQPPGIWEEVAMPESNTKAYTPDKGEGLYRRSLYTFWKRSSAPASMETFDATSREVVCTKRARTNTPLQAFVTMNDPQWVEAARKLAERAVKAAPATEARLDFLARATISRPLEARELEVLKRNAEQFSAAFAKDPADATELLKVGESKSDETLNATELATWTMVASQCFNLDEFLNK